MKPVKDGGTTTESQYRSRSRLNERDQIHKCPVAPKTSQYRSRSRLNEHKELLTGTRIQVPSQYRSRSRLNELS